MDKEQVQGLLDILSGQDSVKTEVQITVSPADMILISFSLMLVALSVGYFYKRM